MFRTINDRRHRLIPWVLTLGLVCVSCRQPNNQPGNPFVQTRHGFAHADCVAAGAPRTGAGR
jgi:hypothetical protein